MGNDGNNINNNYMGTYGNDQADNQYQAELEYNNQCGNNNNYMGSNGSSINKNYMGSYCSSRVNENQDGNQHDFAAMNW